MSEISEGSRGVENKSGFGSDTKRQGRLITGVLGLVLSAVYAYMAYRLPMGKLDQPGAGVFPLVVAAIAAVASLLLVAEQVAEAMKAGDGAIGLPRGADLRRLVGFGASIAVYIVLAMFLGNLIAGFVMCLVIVRLLDPRSWRRVVVTAAAIALGAHFLFVFILGIPLPEGSLLR